MALPTKYYVDRSIDTDSGAGSVGNPYGRIQHALDTVTRDATNGDEFCVFNTGSPVLAASIDLTTYGAQAATAPVVFRSCDATGAYVYGADFDLDGSKSLFAATNAYMIVEGMRIHNSGANQLVEIGGSSQLINCRFDDCTNSPAVHCNGSYTLVINCEFADVNGRALQVSNSTAYVAGNWFRGGNKLFTVGIYIGHNGAAVFRNMLLPTSSAHGIQITGLGNRVSHNSILAANTSGTGIIVTTGNRWNNLFSNNLIEGFASAGVGIGGVAGNVYFAQRNAFFNCATRLGTGDFYPLDGTGDNETLGSSPFAKNGAATFANRFKYFAPRNVGNVRGGAWPGNSLDKGAVQSSGIVPVFGGGVLRR